MSGIAASIGPVGSAGEEPWLSLALSSMEAGCPDGSGRWSDDQCALGHALLRTGPFDEGDQPLSFDGNVWITADVRLDDRETLVAALRARGRNATLRESDAALTLHAYHGWGWACVEHLAGDYAFAIRDRSVGGLFCARDHFGCSPLYYMETANTLLVASSAAALWAHPGAGDALDERAIADFLLFGMYMEQGATAHAAIRRLPPAHTLVWADGRARVRPYWKMPEPGRLVRFKRAQEYVDQFRDLLTAAVTDRLGDGPVTTHLSGGLDSTSVTATAHRVLTSMGRQGHLRAQTTRANEVVPGDEEGHFAGLVADALGIIPDVTDAEVQSGFDLFSPPPIRLAGPIPYHAVMHSKLGARAAAHGRVVLSGFGADPLLLFEPSYWIDHLTRGHPFRLAATIWDHIRLFHRLPRFYVRPALRYRIGSMRTPAPVLPTWLGGDLVGRPELEERLREVWARERRHIGIRGMAALGLWGNLFELTDPGFTCSPVRTRHPFFDLRLVRYALSLPPVPWFPRKHILREAMSGILPEAVRRRPKTPIGVNVLARLVAKRGLDRGFIDIVTQANGLSAYVDREPLLTRVRALSAGVEASDKLGLADFNYVGNALALSYWLYHLRARGSRS